MIQEAILENYWNSILWYLISTSSRVICFGILIKCKDWVKERDLCRMVWPVIQFTYNICVLKTYEQKNEHSDTDIRDIKVSNWPSLSFKFTSAPLDI